jgi:hypothetical protein
MTRPRSLGPSESSCGRLPGSCGRPARGRPQIRLAAERCSCAGLLLWICGRFAAVRTRVRAVPGLTTARQGGSRWTRSSRCSGRCSFSWRLPGRSADGFRPIRRGTSPSISSPPASWLFSRPENISSGSFCSSSAGRSSPATHCLPAVVALGKRDEGAPAAGKRREPRPRNPRSSSKRSRGDAVCRP